MPNYQNLTDSAAWRTVLAAKPFDITQNTPERVAHYSIPTAGGLSYNYASKPVDDTTLQALQQLADEQQVVTKYRSIASGEVMNTGEQRMVLHHALRGVLTEEVVSQNGNQHHFYAQQRARFSDFADRVRRGEIIAPNGGRYSTVVQIGIGGSDLGPRALYLALKEWAALHSSERCIEARFISNVDPDDAAGVLADIDFASTLFVLVSKSGTTQETLTNEQFVAELASRSAGGLDLFAQTVVVTSQTSPLATSGRYLEAFFIDDYIGGRYSATSAVGGVTLSVAFGSSVFEQLLEGAHEADQAALEPQLSANAALADALIGVYERNALGYPSTAVLPYSQALSRFPAHLQQLDMESNGKSVNRDGRPIDYPTGPVVFGEPGTNGQHSFYQLLHQGTDTVPLQFIGFRTSQRGEDTTYAGSTSHTKLNANLAAQIVAFAAGHHDTNGNKNFQGGRPSSLIVGEQLTPRALGALLSHFENKVMFQGLVWNINSFDQEGVQLGKVLTKELLAGGGSATLRAYATVLGIA